MSKNTVRVERAMDKSKVSEEILLSNLILEVKLHYLTKCELYNKMDRIDIDIRK